MLSDDHRADTPNRIAQAARLFGLLLTLIAITYVFWGLLNTDRGDWARLSTPAGWFLILSTSVFYGGCLFLTLFAWLSLLGDRSKTTLTRSSAYKVFGLYQIYKYIPGNVFHQVGR